ncbi:MAG: hypothetical protein M0Z99_35355, partial [Betaproteobacteria bacterium]|nr:hypothetical protein [Betaproteobacteria bacterium]
MSGWAIRRHSPEAHRGEPWGSALGIYREHWGKLGGIVPPKGRKKAHSANVGLFCKLLIYFILLAEWTTRTSWVQRIVLIELFNSRNGKNSTTSPHEKFCIKTMR